MDDNLYQAIKNAMKINKELGPAIRRATELAQLQMSNEINLPEIEFPNIHLNRNFIEQTVRAIEIQKQMSLNQEMFKKALETAANMNSMQLQKSFNRLVQVTNDAFSVNELSSIDKNHSESTKEILKDKTVLETVNNSNVYEDETADNLESKIEKLKVLIYECDFNVNQQINDLSSHELNQIIYLAFSINYDLNNGTPTLNKLLMALDFIVDKLVYALGFSALTIMTVILKRIGDVVFNFYIMPFLNDKLNLEDNNSNDD